MFSALSEDINRPTGTKNRWLENAEFEKETAFKNARKYLDSHFNVKVSDEELNVFYHYRFSSSVARSISKLIDKIYFNKYISNQTMSKADVERGIIKLNLKNQEELLITELQNVEDIAGVKNSLTSKSEELFPDKNKDYRWAVTTFVKKIIMPNLTLNTDASNARKDAALKTIKPTYFKVLKNEMIVREGEKITPSIQDKLDAHYAIKGGKKRLGGLTSLLGVMLIVMLMAIAFFSPVKKWNPKRLDLKNTFFFLVALVLFQFILIRFGLIISDAVARAFPVLTPQDCFLCDSLCNGIDAGHSSHQ